MPTPRSETQPKHVPGPERRPTSIPGNLVRGALIGVVETVPGVSGGTVALVVGIYHDLIDSASHLLSALRIAVTGPDRSVGVRRQLGLVRWRVVLPVLLGMVVAVFTAAGPVADAVDAYPVQMRALFFGLYEPTLRAVDERDLAYLALFMLGMVIGLAVVVKALKWLLEHWHTLTLTVLTGVMAGGLRVLWPWHDEQRALHGPDADFGPAIALAAVGFLVVAALVALDAWTTRRVQRARAR